MNATGVADDGDRGLPADRPLQAGRLAELYQATAVSSVRLAYLLTGDRALAEDIAQDAFVRVAGRLVHLRSPGAFDAYLRRTIVNLAKNHFRRRSVERMFLARQAPSSPSPATRRTWSSVTP